MRVVGLLSAVVMVGLASGIALGCGESFSADSTSTGAGGATSAGGGAAVHGSATASTGTGATTTGTGGSGGSCTVGDLTTCPPNHYCQEGDGAANICTSCTAVTRFQFATPAPIEITLPNTVVSAAYPRVSADGTLRFAATGATSSDLASAQAAADSTHPTTFVAVNVGPPGVATPFNNEAGPLFLLDGSKLEPAVAPGLMTAGAALLFQTTDSAVPGAVSLQVVLSGSPTPQKLMIKAGPISKNVNAQVAFADQPALGRFWYLSNAENQSTDEGKLELVTAKPGADPKPVKLKLDNGCPPRRTIAPWVTPEGTFMVHHARYPTPGAGPGDECLEPVDTHPHLFSVELGGDGQPMGTSVAIFPGDAHDYVTPSLSPDMCMMYFVESSVATPGGAGTILYAVRK